jgi:acetyltransferase-like isoleucine patch superfamily enzyme
MENVQKMKQELERAVAKAIRRLRNKGKLRGVRLSTSHKPESGVDLASVSNDDLRKYIGKIARAAYFHGVEPAKRSWHQINGLLRPIISAGIIELGKVLPYLPGIDKNSLYRAVGIKIGKNTTIAPRVQFDYFHPELIEIGDNCLIGDNAKLWTHDYGIDYFLVGPVKIGNNVRVGSESVIGPSTTIGDNVEVNFGAFVYRMNIPDNAKVRGRERSTYEK